MKPKHHQEQLFRVLAGSNLYGTATEKSDLDYKVVFLPDIDDLLMGRKLANSKEKPEGHKASDSMGAGEVETEYVPLHTFLEDFYNGQTYALELAFAVRQNSANAELGQQLVYHDHANTGIPEPTTYGDLAVYAVNELIDKFLTKSVKKMVGYAVAQAAIYGLKTERYDTVDKACKLLNDYLDKECDFDIAHGKWDRLGEAPHLIEKLAALPHVKKIQLLNAAGGTELAPGIEVVGKQFSYTSRIDTVLASLQKTLKEYGQRVKDYKGESVDWKALSHAIRITEQVLELCGEGKLEFPRPNAEFLLSVKSGAVSLDDATVYLNEAFAKIDTAIANSALPERDAALDAQFAVWKLRVLKSFYGM